QTFAATRADGDLANPKGRVCRAIGPHWFEALIVVIVTVQYEVGTAVVQRLPERCRLGADEGAIGCGAELRMVHHSHGTRLRMTGELGAQPLLLPRSRLDGIGVLSAGVQHDDEPIAQREVVVTLARIAGRLAEVAEVAVGILDVVGARIVVIVIPQDRTGPAFGVAPGRVVAVG